MKLRILVVGLGALTLSGAALGAGVALGSGSSHRDSLPPKTGGGAPAVSRATIKQTKPKAQAYVFFATNGAMYGPSKKVLAVHHIGTGFYCVELATSIHVSDYTFVNAIVAWSSTPSNLTVPQQFPSSACPGDGYPNSVGIVAYANDAGTAAPADAGIFVTVP